MAPELLEEKAKPDEGTLAPGEYESLAGQKVQLDIDDAPFLLDPEDEPDALPAPVASTAPAVPEKNGRKKKLIIIGGAALLLLLIVAAAVWFFVFKAPPPPPAPEAPVIVVPSKVEPVLPKEYSLKLEPFWVPLVSQDGQQRFLVATFVVATESGLLYQEMEDKLLIVRDALFYYLRNKDYDFLTNPENAETIRTDLCGSVNNYLVQGELKNLYFDSFLVQ